MNYAYICKINYTLKYIREEEECKAVFLSYHTSYALWILNKYYVHMIRISLPICPLFEEWIYNVISFLHCIPYPRTASNDGKFYCAINFSNFSTQTLPLDCSCSEKLRNINAGSEHRLQNALRNSGRIAPVLPVPFAFQPVSDMKGRWK